MIYHIFYCKQSISLRSMGSKAPFQKIPRRSVRRTIFEPMRVAITLDRDTLTTRGRGQETTNCAVRSSRDAWSSRSMSIYVDADACPVKEEVYRVARRYKIKVYIVANVPMRGPAEELIELVVVKGGFDAADDWIAERIGPGDIAITSDIPLADRCLRRAGGCRSEGVAVHGRRHRGCRRHPCPARHAATVRRVRRRPRPVHQGGPLAIPLQARRGDPRDPT